MRLRDSHVDALKASRHSVGLFGMMGLTGFTGTAG